MINLLFTIISIILLTIGLISMITPIPGGVIMISSGLTMLICANPTARKCIRYTRTKYEFLNKFFFFLEKKIGVRVKVIGVALAKTQPGANEN